MQTSQNLKSIVIKITIYIIFIIFNIFVIIPAITYHSSEYGFDIITPILKGILVLCIYVSFIFGVMGIFYKKDSKFIFKACIPTIIGLLLFGGNIPKTIEEQAFQNGYYNNIDTSNIEKDSYTLELKKTNSEYPGFDLTMHFKGVPPDDYYLRIDSFEDPHLRIDGFGNNKTSHINAYFSDLISLEDSQKCLDITSIFDSDPTAYGVTTLNFDTGGLYIRDDLGIKLYQKDIVDLAKKTENTVFKLSGGVGLTNNKRRITNRYSFKIESPINPWKGILDTISYAKKETLSICHYSGGRDIDIKDIYAKWK